MRRFKPSSRPEEGSALMFALLALVFLTIIGLSLAVVTETEMMIGSNEQIAQETFYAAEAGIAAAVSRLMVTNSMAGDYFFVPVRNGDNNLTVGDKTLGYVVDFTDIYPISWADAPWTKANSGYLSVFFHVDVRARRMAWDTLDSGPDCESQIEGTAYTSSSGDNPFDQIQAEKQLNLGFFVSPTKGLSPDTMLASVKAPEDFGCAEASIPVVTSP